MNEAPLQAGDVLFDVYNSVYLLLLKHDTTIDDGDNFDIWRFWNLTEGRRSWWYAACLEDGEQFRRI